MEASGLEVYVEVNSLEDFAKGKKLFESYTDLGEVGHFAIDFHSMGILEGGTKLGKTSLMFLFKQKDTEVFSIAKIPLSVMRALLAMANNADAHFKNKNLNQECN
jgi:hypothetical protein